MVDRYVLTIPAGLASRLEELDRIAVRIFQLNLLARWADLHRVAEVEPGLFSASMRAGRSVT
jgi:hypothetical protein